MKQEMRRLRTPVGDFSLTGISSVGLERDRASSL